MNPGHTQQCYGATPRSAIALPAPARQGSVISDSMVLEALAQACTVST